MGTRKDALARFEVARGIVGMQKRLENRVLERHYCERIPGGIKSLKCGKIYLIPARLFASPRWGEADTSAKHSERVRGDFRAFSSVSRTRQRRIEQDRRWRVRLTQEPLTRLLRNHPLPNGERERVFDILCNCELLFQQNNNGETICATSKLALRANENSPFRTPHLVLNSVLRKESAIASFT